MMDDGNARTVASPDSVRDPSVLDLEQIRKEGLTGRQLRLARRMAQKHGLPATSDFDAVRLLRAAGINPFILTPILLATFMAGPVGYLAYALLRLAIRPKVAS
jgi:hypothetical protein